MKYVVILQFYLLLLRILPNDFHLAVQAHPVYYQKILLHLHYENVIVFHRNVPVELLLIVHILLHAKVCIQCLSFLLHNHNHLQYLHIYL